MVTPEEFLDTVSSLRRWSGRGERAPHKPLLVLLALARVQRRESRLMTFDEVEEPLRRLLEDFGPPRKSYHPEFPFWHLQSDGIWEVEADDLVMRKGSSSPTVRSLRDHEAEAGLVAEVYDNLLGDTRLVVQAAEEILDSYFPPSIHEDLLAAVGLDVRTARVQKARDPEFRLEVLRAYEYRCAMCGYEGWLDTTPVGLDAAHVRWFAYDGPDTLDNALALCALHHRAFDRGVVSLDLKRRIMVSRLFRGTGSAHALIVDLAGRPVDAPQQGLSRPSDDHLLWHHREVFKGVPRDEVAAAAEDGSGYDVLEP